VGTRAFTLVGGVADGGLAKLDAGRVQGHVAILGAAAEEDVLELLEVAPLAQPEHEGATHVRRVLHRQLEQRAGLLQLLHEPHACQQPISFIKLAKAREGLDRPTQHESARMSTDRYRERTINVNGAVNRRLSTFLESWLLDLRYLPFPGL
jgi:hypothetical protein